MADEISRLICKILEENPGAELELTIRVESKPVRAPQHQASPTVTPKDAYVPTEAEQAYLAAQTQLTCRSCANTGVDIGRGRCVCLGRLAPSG